MTLLPDDEIEVAFAGGVRRADREARVAHGEAVQSTANTYERFELLRNLIEAIDGLASQAYDRRPEEASHE